MTVYQNMSINEKLDAILTFQHELIVAYNRINETINSPKQFLKVKEASEIYNIGAGQLREAIHSGELRSYRPNCRDYILNVSDIVEWIKKKEYKVKKRKGKAKDTDPK